MYIMPGKGSPGIVAFGANDAFCCRRTQPLRKTWCCTSDTLRCVLARKSVCDPCASGSPDESVPEPVNLSQAHQSTVSVVNPLVYPAAFLSFK